MVRTNTNWRSIGADYVSLANAYLEVSPDRDSANQKAEATLLRRLKNGMLVAKAARFSYWSREGTDGKITEYMRIPETGIIPICFWEGLEQSRIDYRRCDWVAGDVFFKDVVFSLSDSFEIVSYAEGTAFDLAISEANYSELFPPESESRTRTKKPGPSSDPRWAIGMQNTITFYIDNPLPPQPWPHGQKAKIKRRLITEVEELGLHDFSDSTAKNYTNQIIEHLDAV